MQSELVPWRPFFRDDLLGVELLVAHEADPEPAAGGDAEPDLDGVQLIVRVEPIGRRDDEHRQRPGPSDQPAVTDREVRDPVQRPPACGGCELLVVRYGHRALAVEAPLRRRRRIGRLDGVFERRLSETSDQGDHRRLGRLAASRGRRRGTQTDEKELSFASCCEHDFYSAPR